MEALAIPEDYFLYSAVSFSSNHIPAKTQTKKPNHPFEIINFFFQHKRIIIRFDVQMSGKESICYTSLKDLLPPPPAAGINSPTLNRFRLQEVPMKSEFVKEGCFSWLHQLLWRNIKEALWKSTEEVYDQGFK
ncbi:hypothetical protein V6N13_025239 [Hibiscus sabdariffa]|uniref:Uncharacterized protein n=1 Tax=Hibiscus sabdariffa TaxID=183260 RepID=A0ABR2AU93_9ROSI